MARSLVACVLFPVHAPCCCRAIAGTAPSCAARNDDPTAPKALHPELHILMGHQQQTTKHVCCNATFARIGFRISFDMLKPLHRASVFTFQHLKPSNPKNAKTEKPKPLKKTKNLKSKSLRIVSVFIHPLVTSR